MSRNVFDPGNTKHTRELCEYAVGLKYDNIPAEVLERVKLMTLHTLGVSMAAKPIGLTKSAVETGIEINGGPGGGATSWVGGAKMSSVNAAYVNGTLADMLDWEDCSWTGHPSAGVFPAAIAVAEERHKSGKAYLESVVTGLDVYLRAAMSVQPAADFNHSRGWGLVSWQIFSAAAAAAKLMDLDAVKTNQAYGMACLYTIIASNLYQATMSNAYHYIHGLAAKNGVLAAIAADKGIDNNCDGLDIPYAYAEQLTTAPRREWIIKDLDKFLLMKILIKHWPANMWVQTPVEIVKIMAEKHSIKADDIEEIVVDPPTQARMHYYPDGFSSLMEAQFSMPYVIASILLDPVPGPQWYTREKMKDPKVLALAGKVKCGPGKEHTLMESFNMYVAGTFPEKTVTIKTKDGKTYVHTQATHKGHPDDMLTRDEFCAIFRNNAAQAVSKERAEQIIEYILNIEKQNDLSTFGDLLK
jgi:2-methylcitrate dehydratase PrpD